MGQVNTEEISSKRKFTNLFNIKSPDYLNNPYRYYAEVREACPVYVTPYGVYILTRYKDIQFALNCKQFNKNYWGPLKGIYGEDCYQESGFSVISQWLIHKNPPDHTVIRRLLMTALSSKKINYLHDVTTAIANDLIDKFYEYGSVDLVRSYAFQIPALVICHLLGIPKEDHDFILKVTSLPNVLLDPTYLSKTVRDQANQSVDQLITYFDDLCQRRKNQLGDDIVSLLLVAKESEGIALSDAELVSNIFFLFGAGHETTMNLISNGLYSLYKNPDQLEKLKNDWSLLPQAISEILRYEAPVQVASPSVSISDVDINGFKIPQGQVMMPILGAACRDPEEYSMPDKFLIERNHKTTLAFGYGIHLCLGAQLARIEGAIAIECLLKRIPNLAIEELENPKWKPVISVRGLTELVGRW